MRFRTTLQLHGRTATGIEVSNDRRGPRCGAQTACARDHRRTHVPLYGGLPRRPLSRRRQHREPQAAAVAAGDEVDVDIELDTQPREIALPAALEGDPAMVAFFASL